MPGELEEKRETNKSAAEARSGKRWGRGTEASVSRGRDPSVRDSGAKREKRMGMKRRRMALWPLIAKAVATEKTRILPHRTKPHGTSSVSRPATEGRTLRPRKSKTGTRMKRRKRRHIVDVQWRDDHGRRMGPFSGF